MTANATEERWVTNYRNSMVRRAAAMEAMGPQIKERAARQTVAAKRNRADALANRRCIMPDCKYVWHKGRLCKKHWAQVPQGDKLALMVDVMMTQRRVAAKHHRKMERALKASLSLIPSTPHDEAGSR